MKMADLKHVRVAGVCFLFINQVMKLYLRMSLFIIHLVVVAIYIGFSFSDPIKEGEMLMVHIIRKMDLFVYIRAKVKFCFYAYNFP